MQRRDGALGDEHHRQAVGREHERGGIVERRRLPVLLDRGPRRSGRLGRAAHARPVDLAPVEEALARVAGRGRQALAVGSTLASLSSVSRPRLSEANGPWRRRRGGSRTGPCRRGGRRRCGRRGGGRGRAGPSGHCGGSNFNCALRRGFEGVRRPENAGCAALTPIIAVNAAHPRHGGSNPPPHQPRLTFAGLFSRHASRRRRLRNRRPRGRTPAHRSRPRRRDLRAVRRRPAPSAPGCSSSPPARPSSPDSASWPRSNPLRPRRAPARRDRRRAHRDGHGLRGSRPGLHGLGVHRGVLFGALWDALHTRRDPRAPGARR